MTTTIVKIIVAAIACTLAAPLLSVCIPVVYKTLMLGWPSPRYLLQFPAYNSVVGLLLVTLAVVLLWDFAVWARGRVRAIFRRNPGQAKR